MAAIEVTRVEDDEERTFLQVRVREGDSVSEHVVMVSPADMSRLARPDETVEELVRRAFEFLLARETKESILSRFDLSVIERYFPEFESAMRAE